MVFCSSVNHNVLAQWGLDLELNVWDWISAIFAILSFGIALATLIYAKKTLNSQRKTEINTQPIMNKETQLFIVRLKVRKLRDSFIFLQTMCFCLEKTKYKTYPSFNFWNFVLMETNDLHESLFYNEAVNFSTFMEFKRTHDMFNKACLSLRNEIENINETSLIREEINELMLWYVRLLGIYKEVFIRCFDLNDEYTYMLLRRGFCTNKHNDYTSVFVTKDSDINGVSSVYPDNEAENLESYLKPRINSFCSDLIVNKVIPIVFNELNDKGELNLSKEFPEFYKMTYKHIRSILQSVKYKGISIADRCLLSMKENKPFDCEIETSKPDLFYFSMIDKKTNN